MDIMLGMPGMIELDSARDCARVCRELGLDFVELNTNFPQYQLKNMNPDARMRTCPSPVQRTRCCTS